MPIYVYKCSACGHKQDVLQKMSDPILTDCPQCMQSTYVKQVTAAGFQLKGTGWYVTDFRDNNKDKGAPAASSDEGASTGAGAGTSGDTAGSAAAAPASVKTAAAD